MRPSAPSPASRIANEPRWSWSICSGSGPRRQPGCSVSGLRRFACMPPAHTQRLRRRCPVNEYRSVLERAGSNFAPLDLEVESILLRRDRKRRNQRITAGIVGIAVFVAAVWIVMSVRSLDRTEKTVVPATSGTTGPAKTGPTGPLAATWDGIGIPPEGTRLSTPVEGEFVRRAGEYHRYLAVYADGRVLSWHAGSPYVLERRLTPEGVARLRSGAIKPWQFLTYPISVPEDAWADAEGKPYAPPRYSLCLEGLTVFAEAPDLTDPAAVDTLPAPAKALLRGQAPDPVNLGCFIVATKDARALRRLLTAAGLPKAPRHGGFTPASTAAAWSLSHRVGIYLRLLWPDGEWHAIVKG